MATIPVYERRIIADAVQSAPNASSNVSASSPVGNALMGLAGGLGDASNALLNEQRRLQAEAEKKREDLAAVDVANVLSQGEVYWQEESTNRMKDWTVGAPDMREGLGKDFDAWVSESEKKLPTERSRQYFKQHAIGMRTRLQTNAYKYQEQSTTAKLNADTDAGMQADENVVYADPTRLDDVYARRVETLAARSDLSEADKIKAADQYRRKLYLSVERGEMERDPGAWYRKRFGEAPKPAAKDYGARPDGSKKEAGFLGELKLPNGDVATEYSVQSDAVKVNGQRVDFPTLVPTLSKEEIDLMVREVIPNGLEPPESVMRKAIDHAKQRIAAGKPVFATAVGGSSGAGGFDSVMGRIFKHEGGYTASDGNSGAPANFGINQRANPDIDVKNLTKEGAAAIYKERYWDKIKGDNLPPALQGTAMDAAVNQGPTLANRWIQESGGDPVKFNALRREHYERLLEEPKNQRYRKAWLGRLESYEADAASGGAAPAASPTATSARSGQPDALPDAPKSFRGMDWEQQSALRSMAETRMKQDQAQAKATADALLRDAQAMHKDGILDPGNLKPEWFAQTYGADAPRMFSEYQKSRGMAADIGAFKTMPVAEIQQTLTASTPVPGEGYAAADARQAVRMQAAQQVIQQRNTDPAGYVAKNTPALAQMSQRIEQAPPEMQPALTQQYVRASLAEQQRLGIQQPKILTPAQADAVAQRAMTLTKPDDAANLIGGLEQQYGPYFPQVFDQLVKEGKLAGEMIIIPNLPSASAREAVSRLARVKESDLTQGLDTQVQTAAKEAVTATLAEFSRTVPMMTSQAAGTVSAYETTMRKLTYQFMLGGANPGEASERAREMLLGQYTFDGTMRLPKTVDVGAVQRGAKHMLRTDLGGIDTPADLVGARRPEESAAEWSDTIRARAEWFTRQDDGGLELWAMGANGVRYRVTRGGKPVSYSWVDLTTRVGVNSGRASSGVVQR